MVQVRQRVSCEELLQTSLLGLSSFGCWRVETGCTLCSQSAVQKFTLNPWVEKSDHACFQQSIFFLSFYVCDPTPPPPKCKCRQASFSDSEGMFCFDHTTKCKMEEIPFCSRVWEKHLEESWWEGDAEGASARRTKTVWGVIYQPLSLWEFFFFFTVNFSHPAEMDYRSDHPLFSWCREVKGYLLHGYKHRTNSISEALQVLPIGSSGVKVHQCIKHLILHQGKKMSHDPKCCLYFQKRSRSWSRLRPEVEDV